MTKIIGKIELEPKVTPEPKIVEKTEENDPLSIPKPKIQKKLLIGIIVALIICSALSVAATYFFITNKLQKTETNIKVTPTNKAHEFLKNLFSLNI